MSSEERKFLGKEVTVFEIEDSIKTELTLYEKLLKFCENENTSVEQIKKIIFEEEKIKIEKPKKIEDLKINIVKSSPEFVSLIPKGDPLMGNHTILTYDNSRKKKFLISNFYGYWIFKEGQIIKKHKFEDGYGE